MNFSKKIYRMCAVGTVVITFTCVSALFGAKNVDAVNKAANIAKARALVETAEASISADPLTAYFMLDCAMNYAPDDTIVTASYNNLHLYIQPYGNSLYFPQLELVESMADAPMIYYYVLTEATAPRDETTDSLVEFNTALKAYNRFPDNDVFIENLLSRGMSYLFDKRYVTDGAEITDTLDLSAGDMAFAERLLSLADTIERRNGFSLVVDRTRAGMYSMLEREEDLKNLFDTMESRDTTDIPTLDMLTRLAYVTNDSLRVYELGMKRFEIEPDGRHVYSLYDAMPNDSLRNILADAVLVKAADTDLEPELRLSLLGSLTRAYYETLEELVETTPLLDRIDNVVTEITAEDPADLGPYVIATMLMRNIHWMSTYGYRHWIDAIDKSLPVTQNSDAIGAIAGLGGILASMEIDDPEMSRHLNILIAQERQDSPHLVLETEQALAQHYFNIKNYDKVLDILSPITISDIDENKKLKEEYKRMNPDASQSEDDYEEDDESSLQHWINIQTVISEAQMQTGRVDDALATLNNIIAVDPQNAVSLNNLAYYMAENQRDLTIALSLVNRSLDIEPSNLNAIDTKAWILFKKGDTAGALKELERFFTELNIDMQETILKADAEDSIADLLGDKINLEALSPVLGHLLAVLDTMPDQDSASLARIVDFLREYDPENTELADYLTQHPDSKR